MSDTKHLATLIDASARTVTRKHVSFDEARAFLNGYAEAVPLAHDGRPFGTLLVDEEGLIKQLTTGFVLLGDRYVGNGVVYGWPDDNGDFTACPPMAHLTVEFLGGGRP